MRYPVKHYGVGGVLDQSFLVLMDHFPMLFKMVALTIVPHQIVVGLLFESMQQKVRAGLLPILELVLLAIVMFGIGIPLWFLVNAALCRTISQLYLSRPTTIKESFQFGMKRLLPYLGTSVLGGLAACVGLALFILPGIVAFLVFLLVAPVTIIESKSGPDALRRSWELIKRNIGPLIVLQLAQFIIAIQMTIFAGLIPQVHLGLIVTSLLQGIVYLINLSGIVVFYYSCRCQLENLDLWLLADSIEAGQDPLDQIAVTTA